MNIIEEEKQNDVMFSNNLKKLILIENLDNLGLTDRKRKQFIKFYYNNLEMNLLEALEIFKNETKMED